MHPATTCVCLKTSLFIISRSIKKERVSLVGQTTSSHFCLCDKTKNGFVWMMDLMRRVKDLKWIGLMVRKKQELREDSFMGISRLLSLFSILISLCFVHLFICFSLKSIHVLLCFERVEVKRSKGLHIKLLLDVFGVCPIHTLLLIIPTSLLLVSCLLQSFHLLLLQDELK